MILWPRVRVPARITVDLPAAPTVNAERFALPAITLDGSWAGFCLPLGSDRVCMLVFWCPGRVSGEVKPSAGTARDGDVLALALAA